MESVSHWHNAIVRINIFAEVEKAILARGIEANLLFFHRRGKRRAKIILEQLQLDFIRVGRKFATFSSLHHHHRQFVRLQVDRKTVRKIKWQWRLDQLCKLYSYPRNDDHFLLFFFSSLDHEHESHSSVFRTKWSLREQHEFFFFPTWKLLSRKKSWAEFVIRVCLSADVNKQHRSAIIISSQSESWESSTREQIEVKTL